MEKAEVQHFVKTSFNHSMVLLNNHPEQSVRRSRFIYDHRWYNKLGCKEAIQGAWNIDVTGSRLYQFNRKLRNIVRSGLLEWRKKDNSNSREQITTISERLDRMCEEGSNRDWESWRNLKIQFDEGYKK